MEFGRGYQAYVRHMSTTTPAAIMTFSKALRAFMFR